MKADTRKSLHDHSSVNRPYITGGFPCNILVTKRGITAAYSDLGSCLGPKTLKYRRQAVLSPYTSEKTRQ